MPTTPISNQPTDVLFECALNPTVLWNMSPVVGNLERELFDGQVDQALSGGSDLDVLVKAFNVDLTRAQLKVCFCDESTSAVVVACLTSCAWGARHKLALGRAVCTTMQCLTHALIKEKEAG